MKKIRLILKIYLLICFVPFIYGQNLSILYEFKFKDNKDFTKTKIYYLDILKHESVFRSSHQRISDSLLTTTGYGYGYSTNIDEQVYIHKKLTDREIKKVVVSPITRDKVFVKISDAVNWTILPDAQKVGSFNCQKIETDYGGRHWVGWFTRDVSLSEGPYVFNGLPGLIVQINDSEGIFDFSLVSIKNNRQENLYLPNTGKEVSWEELNKIRKDYYTDPFSYVRLIGAKAMEDDGNGGMKKINFREKIEGIRKSIRNTIPIESDHKIDYE
ncbi:GLPGLI family protein [Riemerella anatipestifer]|uniref:GLPGLI family protein n=1 Tax=Riemerella anatipestifer TaxID=34085 RepID=UPI002A874558|nr:GLPGLI family protein [Riemerella anatipestifer]MDY3533729.1 GLPGLI family protein [Riemerella anatipestifer]MDY3535654.1 GLPGLI family protein [Riemerella anatipestifer]